MRIWAVMWCCLWSVWGWAVESTLPAGCQAVMVQGNEVTVQAQEKSLVFVHNLTTADLWVTHPVTEPSASAGWSSRVQGDKWSALFLEKGPFVLTCIESRPGHEQQVPCEGAIAVCQWQKNKFPENAKDTFWVAEDMSVDALIAAVGARGFVIPQ